MTNWKTYRLGDLCDTISDTYKGNAKSVVLINTSDVLEGKCLNHTKEPNQNLKGQFKKTFKQYDILYSEIRPANKRFAYIDFDATDYIASTKLMVLRHNEKIEPLYLYYILQSQGVIDELQMLAESRSGTFPQITYSELSRLEVKLPNRVIQKQILGILGAIDDKIENNRRINANLESQAQALFEEWLSRTSTTKGVFNDIIKTTIAGDWGQENKQGNYTHEVFCIRGADIPTLRNGDKGKMPIRYILEKNYNTKQLQANDIVVEISGGSPTQSTGRVCMVTQSLLQRLGKDLVCTNFCRAITPKDNYAIFIFLYWQMLYNKNTMFSYENGTTGIKNFNIVDFISKEEIEIPSSNDVEKLNEILRPMYNQIYANGLQNETLATLRDTLLPKLMNGEIKL